MENVICEKDFYYFHDTPQLLFRKGRSYKYENDYYSRTIKVHLEYSSCYYPFDKNEFNDYFIPQKKQRKLKLDKITRTLNT